MLKRIASTSWIVLATILFSACGDDGESTSVSSSGSSTITYRLTPEPNPFSFTNGSFIAVKFPPYGTTGLTEQGGLLGTIEVISEAPTQPDLVLDYRITRVEMTTLIPMIVGQISAEGDDIGRIQLHTDGTLSMGLQVPILGITYDLSNANSIYHPDPIPHRYRFEDGRLLLRGVSLRTPVDEPYWGTPLIYVWADPEE
jgi:hypothetical protein